MKDQFCARLVPGFRLWGTRLAERLDRNGAPGLNKTNALLGEATVIGNFFPTTTTDLNDVVDQNVGWRKTVSLPAMVENIASSTLAIRSTTDGTGFTLAAGFPLQIRSWSTHWSTRHY